MQKSDIQTLCERRFRQLIDDYGLPDPDEVQLEDGCVRFLWYQQKVAVQIDLDDFLDSDAKAAFMRDGLPV